MGIRPGVQGGTDELHRGGMGPAVDLGRKVGRGARARALVCLLLLPFLAGCSVLAALDFGGDPGKAFEFRFGWEHGTYQAAPGTPPGGFDKNGVYKPETPEADAALTFPNLHTGVAAEITPRPRVTPLIGITAFEFKVPYARWFSVQAQAGDEFAEVYVGKRLVSVWEITAGPWFGRDLGEHRWALGAAMTLIKF